MRTQTVNHGNGHSTNYKIFDSGTAYHEETPDKVCKILENARETKKRIQLFYGDVETGRDWNEENDTRGTIGRSSGSVKIPILIATSRSYGGGAILDHCIVKIKETETGRILYQAENYQAPKIEIVPGDLDGYTHNLIINGELYSRHRSERSAKLLFNKLK